MRTSLFASLALVFACGASEPAAAPAPAPAPSVMPASSPGAPLAMGEVAPAPPPTPPATPSPPPPAVVTGADRCEGLVAGCGGWIGCVTVRADPRTPGRFVGVGPNAGHFYTEYPGCIGAVCNEVCTGGSLSVCRPGLTEDTAPIICSASTGPSRAPFTCTMVSGVCTQGPDPSMMPAS